MNDSKSRAGRSIKSSGEGDDCSAGPSISQRITATTREKSTVERRRKRRGEEGGGGGLDVRKKGGGGRGGERIGGTDAEKEMGKVR